MSTKITSPVLNLAVSQVRRRPGRIVAVLLAVMISVGYLTATLGFMATETRAVAESVTARTAAADVVISGADGTAAELIKPLASLRTTPGVKEAEVSYQSYGAINGASPFAVQSVPQLPQLGWASLADGHWPADDHQIAIGKTTAQQQNLRIGDTVTVDATGGARKLIVSGITDETRSLFSGQAQNGFVVPGFFAHPSEVGGDLLVIGDGSLTPDRLAATLSDRLGRGMTIQTGEAYGQEEVRAMTNGTDVFQDLLLIFGAIALLVGSILIVNTFLILLAQRRRQVGLLRAVGATGSQVRRSMLIEAVITGLIGSVLGVAVGVGVAAAAAAVSGSLRSGLAIPPTVALAAAVGVLVTLLAALGPAARATRVSPLDALRPVADAAATRRISVLTAIPSLLVAAVGVGLIVVGLGSDSQPLLLCVAGSILLAIGVLIGAKLYFPALIRLLGLLTRPLGPIGRLATSNTARNPGRAAATGAALMLATGLIVTLQVGAASVKESTNLMFDQHYPVDVTVSTTGALPSGVADEVAGIKGITTTAPVRGTTVKVRAHDQTAQFQMTAGDTIGSVINEGAGSVPRDRVLMDAFMAENLGVRSGDKITVSHGSWHRTLTVEPNRIAADGALVVTPQLLAEVAPKAPITGIWAKADATVGVVGINSALTKITKDHPEVTVSGSLTSKASYAQLLDTLLTVATVLLGVAVLIALIGVGNTLGLSVIERSRETALLRALGLQRRQLRLMLGLEAVLLALGGAIVGIAAGALFGWIGTKAVVGTDLDYPTVVFVMSAPQTVVVGVVAITAGVLASILPGRRAARSAPIEALAEA